MQKKIEGAIIDSTDMTLEKLENLQDELRKEVAETNPTDKLALVSVRQKLFNINHQILMRKLIRHKYRPTSV